MEFEVNLFVATLGAKIEGRRRMTLAVKREGGVAATETRTQQTLQLTEQGWLQKG